MTTRQMEETKANKFIRMALRIGVSSALHPLEYSKVLIQIGYEPIAPRLGKTFFGKPALVLPNIFQYVKHIRQVDGLAGCYRGLTPKLIGSLAGAIGSEKIIAKLGLDDTHEDDEKDDVELTDEESFKRFQRSLKKDLILHATGIIITHPFQVISIRMMAQFVGKETLYDSLWSSIKEIVRQDGILGFFAGLIPKLVCDLSCIVLASTTCFIVHKYYIHDAGSRTYFAGFAQFAYATLLYPLHVVSNCMIVSGSRLQAGNPPQMPVYYNWSHCWKHLHSINEHKRGSSLFWRYYQPRVILDKANIPYPQIARY